MKRIRISIAMLLLLAMCVSFVGCAQKPASNGATGGTPEAGGLKVLDIVYSALGDGGISDAVFAAIQSATTEKVDVYECNTDPALFETSIMEGCRSGEYDLIVAIYGDMVEAVMKAAEAYPDQKILILDAEVDYSSGKYSNVVSYQVKQNEASFLAGALAAILTTSGVEGTNPDKVVGFIGGVENTTIQDFLIGYIEGVNYVDSEIEVLYSFIGDWSNTAKAKELGYAQIQQGADVSYSGAGNAGLGSAEAALESGCWNIACDQDWSKVVAATNADLAEVIIVSAAKDLVAVLGDALAQFSDGTLQFGKHNVLGWGDGAIVMYFNDTFKGLFTDEMLAEYQQVCDDLAAGKIEVGTSFGATTEEINAYKEQAKPFTA